MKKVVAAFLAAALLAGCSAKPKDDGYTAQKTPVPVIPDSFDYKFGSKAGQKDDTSAALKFGFSVAFTGGAEIHFYDGQNNHTGPASPEEYLPMLENLLKDPNIHSQERYSLEAQKEAIERTGSAAQYATLRQIANLTFKASGDAKKASYIGGDELMLRIRARAVEMVTMEVRTRNPKQPRTALYRFAVGPGQGWEMNLSAVMEDFTLSWDSQGNGKFDKEIEPVELVNGTGNGN